MSTKFIYFPIEGGQMKELLLGFRDLLTRVVCIAVAGIMATLIFLGAEPHPDSLISIVPPWDKVAHFVYYGIMAGLLAHGAGRRWLWLPLVLVPLVGAADELNQAGIPGRDSSVWDWVADLLGAVAAVAAYRYAALRRRT